MWIKITGGLILFGSSLYAGLIISKASEPYDPIPINISDLERHRTFQDKAKEWDGSMSFDEGILGINFMRRSLVKRARGDVLEIGCGTGRNFDYFNPKRTRVVAIDNVGDMVEIASKKAKKICVKEKVSENKISSTGEEDLDRIRVFEADAHKLPFHGFFNQEKEMKEDERKIEGWLKIFISSNIHPNLYFFTYIYR